MSLNEKNYVILIDNGCTRPYLSQFPRETIPLCANVFIGESVYYGCDFHHLIATNILNASKPKGPI